MASLVELFGVECCKVELSEAYSLADQLLRYILVKNLPNPFAFLKFSAV
jgi:hypothetical protein